MFVCWVPDTSPNCPIWIHLNIYISKFEYEFLRWTCPNFLNISLSARISNSWTQKFTCCNFYSCVFYFLNLIYFNKQSICSLFFNYYFSSFFYLYIYILKIFNDIMLFLSSKLLDLFFEYWSSVIYYSNFPLIFIIYIKSSFILFVYMPSIIYCTVHLFFIPSMIPFI